MIPHVLHDKEYFWNYDEKYDIFFYYYFLFFTSFNRKYLNLIKMDISVFEFKLFICSSQPSSISPIKQFIPQHHFIHVSHISHL